MPIRFRCQHCNQLLGIARRKAGTPVQCPTCQHEVIVPHADQAEKATPPAPRPLFEHSDFEAYLQQPGANLPAPAPPAAPPAAHESFDVERLPLPASMSSPSHPGGIPPVGLYLSSTQATLLTVAAILLLALAFGAGLLVGRFAL